MEVGDPAVGVDHGHGRALGEGGLDGRLDGGPLGLGELLEGRQHAGQAVVRVGADALEDRAVFGEDISEEHLHRVTKDDRVGDLHHRGLQVQREEHTLALGVVHRPGQEVAQGRPAHDGGVEDLPGLQRDRRPERGHRAVVGHQLDRDVGGGLDRHRPLVGPEVPRLHGGHVGLRVGRPGTHPVGMLLGVGLDRGRRPPVGVTLPQDGVQRAARHLLVAGLDLLLLGGGRLVGVLRQRVALGLELLDRRLELGDRGADVRELDDVGLRPVDQLPELGQRVADPLLVGQPLREGGQDAPGQGDVTALDGHAGGGTEGRDDREERGRRQRRRLVGVGVDDLHRPRG